MTSRGSSGGMTPLRSLLAGAAVLALIPGMASAQSCMPVAEKASFDVRALQSQLMVLALTNEPAPETIIVAPDAGVTIRVLAQSIAKAMQFNGPIQYDCTKPEGVRVKRLASRSFHTRFREFRFTDLEEGLQETVEWFEAVMAQGRGAARVPAFTMASGR